MRFNNFMSSWVSAVEITASDVVVETNSDKTYVLKEVSALDRLKLIERMVDNANGESASVGSIVHELMDVYQTRELTEPLITRLAATEDKLLMDGETVAYFERGRFQYVGYAASKFFETLVKELNET